MPVVILIPGGSTTTGGIPMSASDPRFATNVPGTVFNNPVTQGPSGTNNHFDWNGNPAYTSGDQVWTWLNGTSIELGQCRIDWREGPRISSDSGLFHVDQCYINCVGVTTDHADAFQAFGPSGNGVGVISLTNTHVRAYTDAEALSKYGAGFIGSTCMFWADASGGSFKCQNVLFHGGERMVTVNVDPTATVHINFDHVYFVQEPGFPITTGWTAGIQSTGGTLIVDNWTNVFNASIVNGVIVPGTPIGSP